MRSSSLSSSLPFLLVLIILLTSSYQSPIPKKGSTRARGVSGTLKKRSSVRDWNDWLDTDEKGASTSTKEAEGLFDGLAGVEADCGECLDKGIFDDLEGNVIDGETNYEDLGAFEEVDSSDDDDSGDVNKNFDLSRGDLPIYEDDIEIKNVEHTSSKSKLAPTPTPATKYPVTCPCKRGKKKNNNNTCWFYIDKKSKSKKCKARQCAPPYICVNKVVATSTCLRKQVKQRVVRDGYVQGNICKTVSINEVMYMYRPYTSRH